MLLIYTMLSITTALCGIDFIGPLICIITHPFHFAAPENNWKNLFLDHLPRYLLLTDPTTLKHYHQGHARLYSLAELRHWVTPLSVWTGFIFVLSFAMLCINTLVRKQWTEHTRLSFPVVRLPLEMTRPDGRLYKNKLMWLGLGLAFLLNFNNGINVLYPAWPSLGGVIYDLSPNFPNRPWNAIGWTPMQVFPFAVGLGFFIPLDLSFSCWFFYLFWKVERVLSSALGFYGIPRSPFVEDQCFGAYLMVALISIYLSRDHLRRVVTTALSRRPRDAPPLPSDGEPMPYSVAFWGFLGSLSLLWLFSIKIGMSWWIAGVFFLFYFAVSLSVSRLRAELGAPVHDLHLGGAHYMITNMLGTKPLGMGNLTSLTFFQFFNRAYRGHEMPHQLEGMKLATDAHLPQRSMLIAILVAVLFGTLASFWGILHMSYTQGGHYYFGGEAFNQLANWINQPRTLSHSSLLGVFAGALMTLFLYVMRMQFMWWPFHPAGFAVSGSWSMNLFWLSLLIAWLVKRSLLKYAGMESYQKAIPFFMGLILGDFLGGGMWTVYGIWLQKRVYNFLP
ncbi:MAG: hypothetical protein HY318_08690 [Armatimonadetes bacterium]|nr:hypothetical protein [Armatimonadota bacterium]